MKNSMKLDRSEIIIVSLTVIILVGFIIGGLTLVIGDTPQKQFMKSHISKGYDYKVWMDEKYQQAMDSGWISNETYELICDLELEGASYGRVIEKSNAILDSIQAHPCELGFPYALPDTCLDEQIRTFLQNNHGDRSWWSYPKREEISEWSIKHPGDSLLVEYESTSVEANGVGYSFSYTTCNDTVVSITLSTTDKVLDVMNFKFGKCLLFEDKSEKPYVDYNEDVSTKSHYYYTWINDDFIIKLHEFEYTHKYNTHYKYYFGQKDIHNFTSTITYTNRHALHSYYKAYKRAKSEYEEQQRLKKEQERVEKLKKEQEALQKKQEQERQDSIRRSAGAMINL